MSSKSDFVYVYMGSGAFSGMVLRELLVRGPAPRKVITTPPKPKGRGRKLRPSPVEELARGAGIPVAYDYDVPDCDFIFLSDFGRMVPGEVLALPRVAPLNLHPSLLPRWRGAAPIERAIMAGDRVFGLSVMVMTQELDAGPLVLCREVDPGPWPTKGELVALMAPYGALMLLRAALGLMAGSLKPTPQRGKATYAKKIEKDELWVSWDWDADRVARHINALSPKPGARARLAGREIKPLSAVPHPGEGSPGEIIGELVVACGKGAVKLEWVLPPGRRPMRGEDYLRGLR